jgi:arylsulfatase A-like enzyme
MMWKIVDRIRYLLLIGGHAALLLSAGGALAAPAVTPPNVLVIVADDLGYADLGVQGCKDVPTPEIDSIANSGVRCTSGYVSCPVCSPTRAGLMTGRYQQRFGHEFNPGPADEADPNFGLPLTETTFATRMKSLSYRTGAVGKWHLGYQPQFHPLQRGFEEFFGFLGGSHSYFDNKDKANPIVRGTEPVEKVTYTTDMFGDEAADFVKQNASRPWMLYLAFNAVHSPMQGTDERLARFASIKDSKRQKFAAMLSAMDENVGKVLKQLRASGLEEQTLVFFISDNGGPTPVTSSLNTPLDGTKADLKEGGIRVPFFVQWKGRLPAGKTYDQPVIALDILPTAVAVADGENDPLWKLDGVNLLPYLRGDKSGSPHEYLYWRNGAAWAIRGGDWKLRQTKKEDSPQLFNLASDIAEQHDVAAKNLEIVARLQAAWDAWNAQLEAPRWNTMKNGEPKQRKGKKAGKDQA